MRRMKILGLVAAVCLAAGGLVYAGNSTQVTNPEPVVAASMTLVKAEPCPTPNNANLTLFTWDVTGKLKPKFRGFYSDIKLVCNTFGGIEQGGAPAFTFPSQCNSDGCFQTSVDSLDACGNFEFHAQFCGTSPQLDDNHVCTFVTHLRGDKSPQSCNKAPPPTDQLPDPNGSGPCGGGLCPDL